MPRAAIFGTVGDEGVDQQTAQAAREPQARPAIAVENPVVVREAWILVEAGDAQSSGDGASPGAQDRANDKSEYVLPSWRTNAALNGSTQERNVVCAVSSVRSTDICSLPTPRRGEICEHRLSRKSQARSQATQVRQQPENGQSQDQPPR